MNKFHILICIYLNLTLLNALLSAQILARRQLFLRRNQPQQQKQQNVEEQQEQQSNRDSENIASPSSTSLAVEERSPRPAAGERCWDPFLKRLQLGTEENCENELETEECDALFPVDGDANRRRMAQGRPPAAHENCDRQEMAEKALKCAKNCYICCELPAFACKNPRKSANFKCHAKVGKCRHRLWIDVMKVKCPRTCGLCDYERPNRGECRDSDEFCKDRDISLLCTDGKLRDRMTILCPKTCESCDKILT